MAIGFAVSCDVVLIGLRSLRNRVNIYSSNEIEVDEPRTRQRRQEARGSGGPGAGGYPGTVDDEVIRALRRTRE